MAELTNALALKSPVLPGAHERQPRKSCKDVFNAFMTSSAALEGYYGIPKMDPVIYRPKKLIPFSEAVGNRRRDYSACVHFYEHDVKFERFWRNPEKYIEVLARYDAIIAPDYSLYHDFPKALQIYNTYRNYASGAWFQERGLRAIANVRLDGESSLGYGLAGAPHGSTIAIGLHGCTKQLESRTRIMSEIQSTVDMLEPASIIAYGSDAYGVLDYPRKLGIPIDVFRCETSEIHGEVHHG